MVNVAQENYGLMDSLWLAFQNLVLCLFAMPYPHSSFSLSWGEIRLLCSPPVLWSHLFLVFYAGTWGSITFQVLYLLHLLVSQIWSICKHFLLALPFPWKRVDENTSSIHGLKYRITGNLWRHESHHKPTVPSLVIHSHINKPVLMLNGMGFLLLLCWMILKIVLAQDVFCGSAFWIQRSLSYINLQ